MGENLLSDTRPATTAQFAQALAGQLRLPAPYVSEIVAETRGHIADRIDDLVAGGMSQSQAEQSVIDDLGSARIYARRISDGFFASRVALRASRAGKAVLWAAFLLMFLATVFGNPFIDLLYRVKAVGDLTMLSVIAIIPALTLTLGFQARRAQTNLIVVFGLAMTIVALASTGCYVTRLPNHEAADRRNAAFESHYWGIENPRSVSKLIGRIDAGLAAYSGNPKENAIPADLRFGSGFVVPAPKSAALAYILGQTRLLSDPFHSWIKNPRGQDVRSTNVANTLAQAKLDWIKDGQAWRDAEIKQRAYAVDEARYYQTISREPITFNPQSFDASDLQPVLVAIILGTLDFLGAWAGRRAFLIARRRRGRGPLVG